MQALLSQRVRQVADLSSLLRSCSLSLQGRGGCSVWSNQDVDLRQCAVPTLLERAASSTHTSTSGREHAATNISPQLTAALFWRAFSTARPSLAPETEATPTAEINPLLQTPARADEEAASGTPSYYGPGKAVAKLRGIAMSPKKMNLFAAVVRRKHVEDALAQCRLSPKKAAKICAGVIWSARANAENNHGLDASKLMVDVINVGRGQHLKRVSMHGRGKSGVRLKYRCHLEVVLRESEKAPKMKFVKPLLERPPAWQRRRRPVRRGGSKLAEKRSEGTQEAA